MQKVSRNLIKTPLSLGQGRCFYLQKTKWSPRPGANIHPDKERWLEAACTSRQASLSAVCSCKRLILDMFQRGKHQAAMHAAADNAKTFMAKDRKVRDAHQVHISAGEPQ